MLSLLALLALVLAPHASGDPNGALAPLTDEPELRWSFGPFGFESEPLLENGVEGGGERILLAGRDPTGRRALVVLEVASGRVLSRTLLTAAEPLAPAFAGERVAVRTAPTRVDLFRLRGARLLAERSFVHAESISVPRLEEDELFLREGDALAAYDLTRAEARWRTRVPGAFAGAPFVQGERLFALWFDANQNAHLACLARASGEILGDVTLGRTTTRAGPAPEEPTLTALDTLVFVHLPEGLSATTGENLEWVRVPFDGQRFGSPTLHALLAAPLASGAGWIAPERLRDGQTRWVLAESEAQAGAGRVPVVELASPLHHAWLAASHAPASRAGGVLYLGPCAVDERSLQVLWRRTELPEYRPVPVANGLLVIEHGVLRCLGALGAPADPHAARAASLALARERALGERLAQLASRALRAGDAALAQELVLEAEDLGASGRTVELVRAEAERRHETPVMARAEERRAALRAEEAAARAALTDELAEAARRAADPRDERALLTELFRRDPAHPAGRQELRRLLPPGAPFVPDHATPGDALAWLEYLEHAAARPMDMLVPSPDGRSNAPEQERLATERAGWRPDVVGYQSERLLVVTAGAGPGAVARMLEAGELVCDGLARTFGGERAGGSRLELVVYPTRAEYLEHSGSDLGGLESVLGFTSGHFDLAARVSRLYLPEQDEDSARLVDVSVHELVHHWLATRSSFGSPRSTASTKGFWVVEAIATWGEEQRLDTLHRTWTSDTARAASLDTLRNAGAGDLLPWGGLLQASFEDYTKLETRTTCSLSLDWQLGASAPRSPLQLFYAQGGALAHYLHSAENGAHRALLTRAVEAWYHGTPLDLPAELGIPAEELGLRVASWARSLTGS